MNNYKLPRVEAFTTAQAEIHWSKRAVKPDAPPPPEQPKPRIIREGYTKQPWWEDPENAINSVELKETPINVPPPPEPPKRRKIQNGFGVDYLRGGNAQEGHHELCHVDHWFITMVLCIFALALGIFLGHLG